MPKNRDDKGNVAAEANPVLVGQPLHLIARNLALLILFGLALSAWVLFYTEWFPVVGGLLGLGGLFAWIAFLANLVPEETKKQLQAEFQTRVLARRGLSRWLLLPALMFLIIVGFTGTLRFDAAGKGDDQVVAVQESSSITRYLPERLRNRRPSWLVVPGHAVRKQLLLTTPLGISYRVRTPGAPSGTVKVFPLWRRTIDVPDWFERLPLVFVLPSTSVTGPANAKDSQLTIQICFNKCERFRQRFRGHAIWLGVDPDEVKIPDELKEEIKSRQRQDLEPLWLNPWRDSRLVKLVPQPEDRINVYVLSEGNVTAAGMLTVPPPGPSRPRPIRIDLDMNDKGITPCEPCD